MEIVEITWLDAACEHENLCLEEAEAITPMTRKNVGYLITHTDAKLVLGFGTIEDNEKHGMVFSDTLVVPAGDVTKVLPLVAGQECGCNCGG